MKNVIGFVYKWTNTLNGIKYIGSHKGTPDDGYIGSGKHFKNAVKKYGIENFKRTILEYASDNLLAREQYYLDRVDAANNSMYYNINPVAGGGWDLVNNNPELIKLSGARIKQWIKENGHPKGMKGKNHTSESIAIMRKASKQWTKENIEITVYQYNYNGSLVKKHNSITDAAIAVNGSPSNIKYTCDGKFRNAYGYLWSYTKQENLGLDINESKGKKMVQTPAGIFDTISEAVKYFNFCSSVQVRRRCLSTNTKWKEWQYIMK